MRKNKQWISAAWLLMWSPLGLAQAAQQTPSMRNVPGMQQQQGQTPPPAPNQQQPSAPPMGDMPGMQTPEKQPPQPQQPRSGPTYTLEQFQQMALVNNPTLRQAQSEIRAAEGRKRQAGLYPNPMVGYEGGEISGGPSRGGEQGFFVQQNIVLGGKLGLSRNIFEQERRQAAEELEEQRLRVSNGVSAFFYQALAAQTTIDLRQQLSQIAADAAHTAHQLFNVGQADTPDVLEAEVEAERAALDVTAAQQTFMQVWRALAASVGQPNLPPGRVAGNLEEIPEINTHEWLAKIVSEAPAVKIAELDVQRRQATLARARREPVPDLQLRGGLQQNRELRELTGRPIGLQGFAEVGVQIPIFNRNQGNVQAAQADLERARQEVQRVKLLLQERASALISNYDTSRARVDQYRTQIIPRAQQAYELYLKKYQSMTAAYPQVLVAQRTLFQVRNNYVAALQTLWTNSVGIQSFLLTDGLEAPSPPGEMQRTIRELDVPTVPGTNNPEMR